MMEHTIQDQGNKDWTVNKKRRRGVEDDENEDMEVGVTCRKFGIILGGFRTEVAVLAELHLRYPWIQLTRRINGAGSALLITKDDRSRYHLAERKNINGKECSFRPLGNQARKAYILMGVPSCVIEELLQQDKEILEASRMTKWNTEKQQAEPTNMVKIVLVGKQLPVRFTRGYGSFRLRPFVSRPLQCFNCQKFGHQARTCRSEVHTCRYCAGRHASTQCNDNENKLWTGACRHQSPMPKETGSRKQSKIIAHTSTQSNYKQTSQQDPSPPFHWRTHGPHWPYKRWENNHQLHKTQPSRNQWR